MSTKIRQIVLTSFVSVLLITIVFSLFFAMKFHRYIYETSLHVQSEGYLIVVPPGTPVHRIADTLAKANVMDHPKWFLAWMQLTGKRSHVKAGEYLIKPGTTTQGFIDMLVSGKVLQHAFTIVPGWTFDRLMQAIHDTPLLTHTLKGLSNQEIMAKLGYPSVQPEGEFFPETYYYPAYMSDLAFLQRAFRAMQERLNKAWESRDNSVSGKTPYDILILASIIEKESSVPEEYAEIAGVYLRRLERNMPLQADPTVIYGMGSTFLGPLTIEHLRKPSTYNTYLNLGLPPTPIAMPSQKAIEAATHPKANDTLYFVATGTDKRHVFSKTPEEHQKAVLRYRAIKAQIEKEKALAVQETSVIREENKMTAEKNKVSGDNASASSDVSASGDASASNGVSAEKKSDDNHNAINKIDDNNSVDKANQKSKNGKNKKNAKKNKKDKEKLGKNNKDKKKNKKNKAGKQKAAGKQATKVTKKSPDAKKISDTNKASSEKKTSNINKASDEKKISDINKTSDEKKSEDTKKTLNAKKSSKPSKASKESQKNSKKAGANGVKKPPPTQNKAKKQNAK